MISYWSLVAGECSHLLTSDSLALRDLGGAIVAELAATFPLPQAAPSADFVDVSGLVVASGDSTPMEIEVGAPHYILIPASA